MSHTPHELAEEFPEKVDAMQELKRVNGHFRKLADDYHEVNRAVHRAETNVEPITPEAETDLRRQRMHLKDQIAAMLSEA